MPAICAADTVGGGTTPELRRVVAEIAFSGPLVKPGGELRADLYRQKIL